MEIRPELLQQMLSCILNIVMFEECRNQYSMSRPLLGLILLNEDYFGQLRQSIVHSQPSRGMLPPKIETGIQFPIGYF